MVANFENDFVVRIRSDISRPRVATFAAKENIRGPNRLTRFGIEAGAKRMRFVDDPAGHWTQPNNVEHVQDAPGVVNGELKPGFRDEQIIEEAAQRLLQHRWNRNRLGHSARKSLKRFSGSFVRELHPKWRC